MSTLAAQRRLLPLSQCTGPFWGAAPHVYSAVKPGPAQLSELTRFARLVLQEGPRWPGLLAAGEKACLSPVLGWSSGFGAGDGVSLQAGLLPRTSQRMSSALLSFSLPKSSVELGLRTLPCPRASVPYYVLLPRAWKPRPRVPMRQTG